MKRLIFIFLLFPFAAIAQNALPRYQHDTLYTSCGYKIYNGQVLHLGNGTSDAGYFRFIKFFNSGLRTDTYTLQNSTIKVNRLKSFKASGLNNYTIRVTGAITYSDGRQGETDIIMDFEKAIESLAGQPGELTVPEEYRNRKVNTVAEAVKQPNVPTASEKITQPVTAGINTQTTSGDIKNLLVADEIKKLFDLYKQGALTREEYEAQKKKLLERQ